MSKRTAALAVLLVAHFLSGGTLAEVPATIVTSEEAPSFPIWVAIDQALTPDGKLRADLFSEFTRDQIRVSLEEAARERGKSATAGASTGCPAIQVSGHGHSDLPSFAELAKRAQLAVIGHVTDRRQGILHGRPLTLFEVTVDEILMVPGLSSPPATLLMIFPDFDHEIDGTRLCVAGMRHPAAPVLGRGVLLFASEIALTNPLLINPLDAELFFETASGVSLPPSDGSVAVSPSWATITRQASDAVKKAPARK